MTETYRLARTSEGRPEGRPSVSGVARSACRVDGLTRRGRRTCGFPGAERAAQREDEETNPRQQQGDAHDDPEDADSLAEVGHVEGRGERRLGHPDVARPVLDRLSRLRILGRL